MKASGKTTICMEKALTNGQIKGSIKDSMLKIRKKALAFIDILMVVVTKVCGRLVDSMEKVSS